MNHKTLLLAAALCLTASRVHADDGGEVDVRSFEYLDVVETTDGSLWKGVVVEQTPNVSFKIATADGSLHVIKAGDVAKMSKQRNKDFHGTALGGGGALGGSGTVGGGAAGFVGGTAGGNGPAGNGVARSFEPGGSGLPAPYAHSGVRVDPSFMIALPQGDIGKAQTSFSPDIRAGYEALFGNLGVGGGAMARFTYWRLPDMEDPNDAAWTLETHAYGRVALHVSRAAFYAGGTIGLDTNYMHIGALNMGKSAMGLGLNIEGGVEVAATPTVALKAGFDYHPGTDTIIDGAPQSISYLGILAGASVRL